MDKDFDKWNEIKKDLDKKASVPLFSEREVWLCSIGVNIGSEEHGKGIKGLRPILVFRKFNKNIFYGLPITSKIKDDKFHFLINVGDINGSVMLSQMKLVDAKRLSHFMVHVPSDDFSKIKEKLKDLIL